MSVFMDAATDPEHGLMRRILPEEHALFEFGYAGAGQRRQSLSIS